MILKGFVDTKMKNEVIDRFGGVTLDDGSYVPAVSHLELCIIIGGPLILIILIPLSLTLTMNL